MGFLLAVGLSRAVHRGTLVGETPWAVASFHLQTQNRATGRPGDARKAVFWAAASGFGRHNRFIRCRVFGRGARLDIKRHGGCALLDRIAVAHAITGERVFGGDLIADYCLVAALECACPPGDKQGDHDQCDDDADPGTAAPSRGGGCRRGGPAISIIRVDGRRGPCLGGSSRWLAICHLADPTSLVQVAHDSATY